MIDPTTLALGARLRADILAPMQRRFVGKDEVVEVLGVALVAGEHAFLHGPPGTAKSALVHDLAQRVAGKSFAYLLTRFTEPSELFGPFDLRRLRDGELVTNTDGMLPEATLVFLDELLNANSAILNSLLTVLNERVFRRGRQTLPLPLLMVVAASNHLPDDDALQALFDRFLLRVRCEAIGEDQLDALARAGWAMERGRAAEVAPALQVDDVRRLHAAVAQVDLEPALAAYVTLVRQIRRAGIALTDRRVVKLQRAIAASALLSGREAARPADLWVLRHVWDTDTERETLRELVDAALRQHTQAVDDHPAARGDAPPDPEALARELEALAADATNQDPIARAQLRDRVALLRARAAWVAAEQPRAFLQQRCAELLASLAS